MRGSSDPPPAGATDAGEDGVRTERNTAIARLALLALRPSSTMIELRQEASRVLLALVPAVAAAFVTIDDDHLVVLAADGAPVRAPAPPASGSRAAGVHERHRLLAGVDPVLDIDIGTGWTVYIGRAPSPEVLAVLTPAQRLSPDGRDFAADVATVVAGAAARHAVADTLERALEAEQRAVQELRRLGELKTSLLSAVSHELRTPLTAVRGFSELLVRSWGQLTPQRRLDSIAAIERNARRLEDLLGDLLDLDRLDRGVVEPVRRETDLAEVVTAVLGRLDNGPRLLSVDVAIPPIMADRPKLERVVENLVVNATVHGGPDIRLWIHAEQQAGGALLTVADDGPGVPDAEKEAIFEPFHRGAASWAVDGTGIGLSLVRRFVELHGGRAWVEDRPGGGAAFHVFLPES